MGSTAPPLAAPGAAALSSQNTGSLSSQHTGSEGRFRSNNPFLPLLAQRTGASDAAAAAPPPASVTTQPAGAGGRTDMGATDVAMESSSDTSSDEAAHATSTAPGPSTASAPSAAAPSQRASSPLSNLAPLSDALPSSGPPPLPARRPTASSTSAPDTSRDEELARELAREEELAPAAAAGASSSFAPLSSRPPSSSFAPPSVPPPDRTMPGAFAPPAVPPPQARVRFSAPPAPQPLHTQLASRYGLPDPFPSGYEPSESLVFGQPFLNGGKLLLPPRGRPCHKCAHTGYKAGDPERPCRRCWMSFGVGYPEQALRVLSMQYNRTQLELQRGVPLWNSSNPLALYNTPVLPVERPVVPAPPRQPRRQVPNTTRTEAASEAAADADGEAPPSYEDVQRAPSDARLPPQRTGAAAAADASSTSAPSAAAPAAASPAIAQARPSSHAPAGPHRVPSHGSGHYPGQQAPYHHGAPMPHFAHQTPGAFVPQMPGMMFRRPPPGAVVVQPGDPRIGGRLCWKCDGAGVRMSLFFGDETCYHCNGLGRIR